MTTFTDPIAQRLALPSGHTILDHAVLDELGIPFDEVQPREQPVPCRECRWQTANVGGGCDRPGHYLPPARALREIAAREARSQ